MSWKQVAVSAATCRSASSALLDGVRRYEGIAHRLQASDDLLQVADVQVRIDEEALHDVLDHRVAVGAVQNVGGEARWIVVVYLQFDVAELFGHHHRAEDIA